ncbi:MAG: DNA polymerase III subunit beta [Ignavibacteriaceae bacterium]|nr:DNA polymerase III subunit beta [Ignavibacteriaceae bacterium]NUM69271.1 DNA polymerase III subunit beta [Ignavibacteriaceae bacterium]
MKFNINSKEFDKVLSKVALAIPARTVLPVLYNVLIDIKDNVLSITASDNENTIKAVFPVNSESDMSLLLPGKLLTELVRNLPDSALTFEKVDDSLLKITSENGEYDLNYLPASEYPQVPEFSDFADADKITLSPANLKRIIHLTTFAASKDPVKLSLTGVLFDMTTEGTNFVATDGHKLVQLFSPVLVPEKSGDMIIPEKTLNLLAKIMDLGDVEIFHIGKDKVLFRMENIQLISRLIKQNYPDYRNVIPAENNNIATLSKDNLLSTVKRVSVVSSQSMVDQVKFVFTRDNLEITVQDISSGSKATENMMIDYVGQDLTIGFKSSHLIDILSHMEGDKITVHMDTPTRAVLIKPVELKEGETLLMLSMPIRLNY